MVGMINNWECNVANVYTNYTVTLDVDLTDSSGMF
jgi:hypothetical protein